MRMHDPSPVFIPVVTACAVMSAITFVAYGVDKAAATRGRLRIPENSLHLLALLGGWSGALVAMQLFRHKRRKTSFVVVTSLIALAHVLAWIWWLGIGELWQRG